MRKLPAVEEARAVMTEAMDWSVWRWMLEKPHVRQVADRATAALDRADRQAKASWKDDLKIAYNELIEHERKTAHRRQASPEPQDGVAAEIRLLARQIKEADDKAERVRLDAEDTFDEAERRMSVSMAREGARKALRTYDLRENAIRKSEAAGAPGLK